VLEATPPQTIPWSDKLGRAFFRGTCTGTGTTPETNQRLHLAHLAVSWNDPSFLDAALTGWNTRDKVDPLTRLVSHVHRDRGLDVGPHRYVSLSEQCRFKYLLYVQGHSAASRFTSLLRTGSCILKVESDCKAPDLWYFPLLEAWVHYVPVKADLSNLRETIEWCRRNDDLCQNIAERAQQFYETHLTQESLMRYMACVLTRMAER
jgi:hypothetical protein